jgi:sugar phosphate isomerase/epimerase
MDSQSALSRRRFLQTISASALLLPITVSGATRKMTMNLVCGNIGVQANQLEAIELAHVHGFESVEPNPQFLAALDPGKLGELLDTLRSKNISWGSANLPLEFRQDDEKFQSTLKELPRLAVGLQKAGVSRIGTWISPGDRALTYVQNFKRHSKRLREAVMILRDNNLRLGLEHVATKSSRDRARFPFIHTIAEMNELIAEINSGNVGHILDSWHWWQAEETVEDILGLKSEDVIAVDINDAPANVAKEKQLDGQRELPCSTGIIPMAGFMNALNKIGYDGPVRAEPFNKSLNQLDNDQACAETITAIKKAFDLLT